MVVVRLGVGDTGLGESDASATLGCSTGCSFCRGQAHPKFQVTEPHQIFTAVLTSKSSRQRRVSEPAKIPLLIDEHVHIPGGQQRRVSFGFDSTRRRSYPPLSSDYGSCAIEEIRVPAPKDEAKAVLRTSIPLTITFLLEFSLTVASVFAVGRIGDDYLAAVSIASMTANITGFAIVAGVATCLDTLCAQAFGRGDTAAVGKAFIRCTYFLFAIAVPIIILWENSESLLNRVMGPGNENVCHLAGQYLRVVAVGLPGFILFENGKHLLQAQGIFDATTYILAVCAPLNAALTYWLVWDPTLGFGFIGAPWAVVITNWTMCILTYGYIFFVDGSQCWPPGSIVSSEYFQKWKPVIRLAIPGILMVEAEWLAFEIITFSAAKFGTSVLAAQTILSTTCILLYQVPFAVGIAATTRIAWYVGGGQIDAAKVVAEATLWSSAGLGIVNATILYTGRRWFASLYTDDPEVVRLASSAMAIAALYQLSDYLSCATGGILKGQGRQRISGYINLGCFYGLALPLAHWLAFSKGLELNGLWIGMVIGLYAIAGLQYYFVSHSDWQHIAEEAQHR